MPKLYRRNQGGVTRFYADLRDIRGGQVALKPPGASRATTRLQTTDNGKQISLWTVAKELGHKTVARVEDTYGHPSHFRPRGEVVEFRVGG